MTKMCKTIIEGLFRTTLILSFLTLLILVINRAIPTKYSKRITVFVLVGLVIPYKLFNSLLEAGFRAKANNRETVSINQYISKIPITAPLVRAGEKVSEKLTETQLFSYPPSSINNTKSINAFDFLFVIYIVGVIIFLLTRTLQYFRLKKEIKKSLNIPEKWISDLYRETCNKMNIRHPAVLLTSDSVVSPVLTFLSKPSVILPKSTVDDIDKLKYAISHELAHHKLHDLQAKLLFLLVNALHWFNPFAWILSNNYNRFCEDYCDDIVVRGLSKKERSAYVKSIIFFAEKKTSVVFGFATAPNRLKKRFFRIMTLKKINPAIQSLGILILVVGTVLCFLAGCFLLQKI